MPLSIKKRVALTGTGLFAASLCAIPLAPAASAAETMPMSTIGDNAAVNVQTEYNCNTHSLTVDVKNKLNKDITPNVVFDKKADSQPGIPPNGDDSPVLPIKPGDSRTYYYSFSGNNQVIPVEVTVDGYDPVEVGPNIGCQEPVSFKVTGYGENYVSGQLTNNNSQFPQTVTLTTSGVTGQRQDITLGPNQSVPAGVTFTPFDEQKSVMVSVTTGPAYESTYAVDLTRSLPVPPVPLPKPAVK